MVFVYAVDQHGVLFSLMKKHRTIGLGKSGIAGNDEFERRQCFFLNLLPA